jgi:hypothetical protein
MRRFAIVRIGGQLAALSFVCAGAGGCARGNLNGDQASGDQIQTDADFPLEAAVPSVDDASGGSPQVDDASGGSPQVDDASNSNSPVEAMVDDALGNTGNGGGPMPVGSARALDAGGSDGPLDSGAPNSASSDAGLDQVSWGDVQADAAGMSDAAADSAVHDSGQDAARCINDLSNIGTADFQVSFSMMGTQTGRTALINQRRICYFDEFWDVRVQNGALMIETDENNQANWAIFTTKGPLVNDGQVHTVLVQRRAGTVTAYIDGMASGTSTMRTSFGALPPMAIGTDPCDNNSTDGTVAFSGKVTNLCITSP